MEWRRAATNTSSTKPPPSGTVSDFSSSSMTSSITSPSPSTTDRASQSNQSPPDPPSSTPSTSTSHSPSSTSKSAASKSPPTTTAPRPSTRPASTTPFLSSTSSATSTNIPLSSPSSSPTPASSDRKPPRPPNNTTHTSVHTSTISTSTSDDPPESSSSSSRHPPSTGSSSSTASSTSSTASPVSSTTPNSRPQDNLSTISSTAKTGAGGGPLFTESTISSTTTVSTATTLPSPPTAGSRSLITSQTAGAIAGGVIGGLAVVALVIWLLFTCLRRRRIRRQWGYFEQGGGVDRSSTPRWMRHLFHGGGGSNDGTSSRGTNVMTPFSDDRPDGSAEGHRPLQIQHLPHFPPMMSGRDGGEPVFNIVGIPSGGASSTTVQGIDESSVPSESLGFGRQARLHEQEQRTTSPSPFADPDPFRSTPPAPLSLYSNPPSEESHESVYALTTDHAVPQVSVSSLRHTANPPSSFSTTPSPYMPLMKSMQFAIAEAPPLPAARPSPPATMSLPALKPSAMTFPEKAAFQQASDALLNSRHRTVRNNPFDDSNSRVRSFHSAQLSFASSGPSVYSDEDTVTDNGTDDGVPTINRREPELHASDLYLPRTGNLRTSRAISSTGFAI